MQVAALADAAPWPPALTTLNLGGNPVESLAEVARLPRTLDALTLAGSPVAGGENYRVEVLLALQAGARRIYTAPPKCIRVCGRTRLPSRPRSTGHRVS